jgi:hypothetical protein
VTKALPNLKEVTTTFTKDVTLQSTLEGKQVLISAWFRQRPVLEVV